MEETYFWKTIHQSGDEKMEDEETEEEEEEEEEEREIWISHYSTSQRILLVGEGDFSFSLCLATAFGSAATNIVSTTIDTQEELVKKYSCGIGNVRKLEEMGCLVLLGVNANHMSQHFFLKTQRFDRIVYNFPHVGFLYPEGSYCQIQLNKSLVKGFLKNAKELIKQNGEIHITHKTGEPYNKWKIEKKAEKIGLLLIECLPFRKQDYPGYVNKRAHGNKSDISFYLGDSVTLKFKLNTNPSFVS